MIRGLDASVCQGIVPYKQLGPDYRFVILKAQEGNDGFDPNFERNMHEGFEAGLEVFAYCFAYPLPSKEGHPNRDPRAQARLFVDRVYRFPEMRGRPIFLDCEWPEVKDWPHWKVNAAFISGWIRDCADEIYQRTGIRPIIYIYRDWWQHVAVADVSWATDYQLWMAWYVKHWPVVGDHPFIPSPWTDWLFWQWDGNNGERLPNGVDSDFCVFNGDEDMLKALYRPELTDFPIVHPAVFE